MKTTLYIQNLKCGGCENEVINKLSALQGISNITIKLQYATVTFVHDTKEVAENVTQMLSQIGYPPYGKKNSLGNKEKSYMS